MKFYVLHRGHEAGPFSANELRDLATRGKIKPSSQVRRESEEHWYEAEDVFGLFPKGGVEPDEMPVIASVATNASRPDRSTSTPESISTVKVVSLTSVSVVVLLVGLFYGPAIMSISADGQNTISLIVVAISLAVVIPLIVVVSRSSSAKHRHQWAAQQVERQASQQAKGQDAETRQRKLLCPHCQETGHVTTRRVDRKKGVSGGKAAAALFTGGLSMLAVGLSRREAETEAKCGNCGSVWYF